ncbi:MAG: ribosome assembly RNA-binding protein YhbY [Spirochaetae bacterium HGW-Spirochaetae-8]|jgi:RNA-binding protein|nr:MAG: ribosome assembly RNA-binding protein YhbY [Spirochaetae bacterium HGW-Spirochaetae-8]
MKSAKRKFLRQRAHELKPVVMLGKNGKDERVVKALDEALLAHELVKLKFQDFQDEQREIAESLATEVKAEVVSIVGHIAIFFRQNASHEDRLIHIPREFQD